MTDVPQWSVSPDNSDCLLKDSVAFIEKLGLDMNKGFNDLCSLATSLSQVFSFEESHSEVYITYDLKGSEEEVIFYEECVEPSLSLV